MCDTYRRRHLDATFLGYGKTNYKTIPQRLAAWWRWRESNCVFTHFTQLRFHVFRIAPIAYATFSGTLIFVPSDQPKTSEWLPTRSR